MRPDFRAKSHFVGVAVFATMIGVGGIIGCACNNKSASAVQPRTIAKNVEAPRPLALTPPGVRAGSVLGQPRGVTGGQNRLIDLTQPGAVARGVATAEIIDTRTFDPQIQAGLGWDGKVREVEESVPRHKRRPGPPNGVQNSLPVGALQGVSRTAPDAAFPGIDVNGSGGWEPPDPTLAVGPDHIVTTVNMAIAFYSKDGTLEFSNALNDVGSPGFFESVGAGGFTFDPKCYYDQYSQRFVVIAPEVYDTTAWLDIAVSDDSNPNGIWYKYHTDCVITVGSDTFWLDYPGLGFDQNGIYVTGNLFGLNNDGWAGALFRIFDKTPMLTGAPVSYADLRDGGAGSVQVAHHFGDNQAPYFVSVDSNSSLRIHAITDPISNPALTSTTVSVPSFDWVPGDAPNVGGWLWTIDSRIFNAQWRDGNLYAAHTIGVGGRNVSRWYQLETNDWPNSGNVTFVQSGNIDAGGSVHTFFPAIFSNKYGNVGLVTASSTSSTSPAVQVTGRTSFDPAGTMGALEQAIIGIGGYDGRWGDYFDITTDPTNDATFWIIGEYSESGTWKTWISSFSVITCAGDLDSDGVIGLSDLGILLDNYGVTSGATYDDGDLSGDGAVSLTDLGLLLDVYGDTCD